MGRLFAVTVLLAVVTLVAIILAGGDIVAAIAPVLVCAVICFLWVAPLRIALLVLAFAAPVLDGPRLANGKVTPPTFALGSLLLENLNKTVGVSALNFTGPNQGAAAAGEEAGKVKTITRDQPKVGRNEPCPCGSGKKYKHCHGRYA